MHLIHVIPRLQLAATYGAPPVDFLPYQVRSRVLATRGGGGG